MECPRISNRVEVHSMPVGCLCSLSRKYFKTKVFCSHFYSSSLSIPRGSFNTSVIPFLALLPNHQIVLIRSPSPSPNRLFRQHGLSDCPLIFPQQLANFSKTPQRLQHVGDSPLPLHPLLNPPSGSRDPQRSLFITSGGWWWLHRPPMHRRQRIQIHLPRLQLPHISLPHQRQKLLPSNNHKPLTIKAASATISPSQHHLSVAAPSLRRSTISPSQHHLSVAAPSLRRSTRIKTLSPLYLLCQKRKIKPVPPAILANCMLERAFGFMVLRFLCDQYIQPDPGFTCAALSKHAGFRDFECAGSCY
jgi:hypothetical protein